MNPPQSPLNPRDFVELLDEFIQLRADMVIRVFNRNEYEEKCELIKRQLTDYLLDIDKRPGVYVKGENEH